MPVSQTQPYYYKLIIHFFSPTLFQLGICLQYLRSIFFWISALQKLDEYIFCWEMMFPYTMNDRHGNHCGLSVWTHWMNTTQQPRNLSSLENMWKISFKHVFIHKQKSSPLEWLINLFLFHIFKQSEFDFFLHVHTQSIPLSSIKSYRLFLIWRFYDGVLWQSG